jgi:arylsulfatase A-like enzyme
VLAGTALGEVLRRRGLCLQDARDLNRFALAFLRETRGRRFFLYVHYDDPHKPYAPPAELLRRYAQPFDGRVLTQPSQGPMTPAEVEHMLARYDGDVENAVRAAARLLEELARQGRLDTTLVVFTADHGEAFGEHGFIGHNKQLYEETARIPLIVRFPKGTGPAGTRVSALVDLADVAPTVADAFGLLGQGESGRFLGRSLLAVASGAPGKAGTVARTAHEDGVYAVTDGRFKLVHASGTGVGELYDLETDPSERTNLAGREAILAAYYRQALHRRQLLAVPAAAAPVRKPTPEELESLRALGYVN